MATTYNLSAESRLRAGGSDIKRMRREGFVPAVIYGARQESTNLKIAARRIGDILRQSASRQRPCRSGSGRGVR